MRRPRSITARWLARLLLLPWLVAACGGPSSSRTVLTVMAASSLTDVFAELETTLEATLPGVDVVVSTAGSQALRVQIEQGAPADVFASANAAHMDALVEAEHVRAPRAIATGELVLVVPVDNPAGLRSLEDLPRARRVVLGTPEVPVGSYARELLRRAAERYGADFRERVEAQVVSLEPNVRLVLAKVELGEADAALVYRSDTGSRAVEIIELPELGVRPRYHAGIVSAAAQPALAEAFLALLQAPEGRAILERHGFGAIDG